MKLYNELSKLRSLLILILLRIFSLIIATIIIIFGDSFTFFYDVLDQVNGFALRTNIGKMTRFITHIAVFSSGSRVRLVVVLRAFWLPDVLAYIAGAGCVVGCVTGCFSGSVASCVTFHYMEGSAWFLQ